MVYKTWILHSNLEKTSDFTKTSKNILKSQKCVKEKTTIFIAMETIFFLLLKIMLKLSTYFSVMKKKLLSH